MKKAGIIGVGSMGSALAEAICREIDAGELMVFDSIGEKARRMAGMTGCEMADSAKQIAETCEMVIFAVQPQVLANVIAETGRVIAANQGAGRRQIVLSIAASWTIEELEASLREQDVVCPVIRLMPNIPLRVGEGILAFCRNGLVTDEEMQRTMELFVRGGLCEEIQEDQMPLMSTIGCVPAMAYMFVESVADGLVQCGMARDSATKYAAQVVLGSAAMVLRSGKHIGALKDELSTPAGMTIGGTNLMERMGFRGAAIAGVIRAHERQFGMEK